MYVLPCRGGNNRALTELSVCVCVHVCVCMYDVCLCVCMCSYACMYIYDQTNKNYSCSVHSSAQTWLQVSSVYVCICRLGCKLLLCIYVHGGYVCMYACTYALAKKEPVVTLLRYPYLSIHKQFTYVHTTISRQNACTQTHTHTHIHTHTQLAHSLSHSLPLFQPPARPNSRTNKRARTHMHIRTRTLTHANTHTMHTHDARTRARVYSVCQGKNHCPSYDTHHIAQQLYGQIWMQVPTCPIWNMPELGLCIVHGSWDHLL
jgi:hypothetical protein